MKRSIFISAFFLLLFTQQLHAQLTWTAIPFNGQIQSFALGSDGSIFAAATLNSGTNGIFRSTDSGSSWTKIYDSLGAITCDSNGAVVVLCVFGAHLSRDTGRTWQSFGNSYYLGIQATQNGFYATDNNTNLNFSSNYGGGWETLVQFADGELADWVGLYCGSDDRVVGTLDFCSCWLRFDSGKSVSDTSANKNCIPVDAPRNIVFGYDGYIYAETDCGLVRLAPGRGQWEIYGSPDLGQNDTVYLPLASQNANSVIYIDSNGTYSSSDHGDSWHAIGTGLNVVNPIEMSVTFNHMGVGYAFANDTLYTTANIPLSVAAPEQSSPISLYPIPCSTNLTVHASNIEQIKVFDLLGTLRIDQKYEDGTSDPELDVSGLLAGVYSMEVISGGATSFVRMIKN